VIGIDPLYFLDEMSMDEMSAIFKAVNGNTNKPRGKSLTQQEAIEKAKQFGLMK
jgi:hypothetical protein